MNMTVTVTNAFSDIYQVIAMCLSTIYCMNNPVAQMLFQNLGKWF